MPEGPEIRRAADRVAKVLVGEPLVDATFTPEGLEAWGDVIRGCRVTAVDTRGKAMLTRFDNGLTMYSHNQLYGRWYTRRRPQLPKTNRQLRVALYTQTHAAFLYSASEIEVLDRRSLDDHPFLSRLGPDLLDPELDADAVTERLRHDRFRNRSLSSLYLDQRFIAGLGNYLRSEILWAARVDPSATPARLDRNAVARLARNTLLVARRSYRTGGLTVPVRLARQLAADGVRYRERRFQVFDRDTLHCRRCGGEIVRTTAAGRNLFLCPACQAE